jgi:hypothetical protein
MAYHIANQAFPTDPVVFMGDLNIGINEDRSLHESYRLFLEHTRLTNAYMVVHRPDAGDLFSSQNDDLTNKRRGKLIDHIMVSPSFQVFDADIDRTMFGNSGEPVDCHTIRPDGYCQTRSGTRLEHKASDLRMYSDHWAVWASIGLYGQTEISGRSTMRLVSLRCNDALEATDEIYLKVNGDTVWGPYDMNSEDTRNIGISIPLENYAFVELWEEDRPRGSSEKDNQFGCTLTIPQRREYSNIRMRYDFIADKGITGDASYTLEYYVINIE